MNEHPFLAELAQLTGEFLAANNPSIEDLQEFQRSAATALLQQQDPAEIRSAFSFQKLDTYATGHLNADDMVYLNQILSAISGKGAAEQEQKLKIFRRETPFASSLSKISVADWAHGAKVEKTIGPIIDKKGKPVWIDLFVSVPGVSVILAGASKPAMVITVQQAAVSIARLNETSFKIPQSSVWINARLLSLQASDNHYCGVTVGSGTIVFSKKLTLENKKIIVPNATTVTVTLNLKQEPAPADSPDNTGMDAKKLEISLPAIFQFSFSHTATTMDSASDASWKLYNQDLKFNFLPGSTAVYHTQLNRVGIPFKTSSEEFIADPSLSKVCRIKGKAKIISAWWSLPCALLDTNNILEAAGAGGMLIQCDKGLTAGWMGLRDLNLEETERVFLNGPLVFAEPGRISVTDLKASNLNARQQYR